MVPHVEVSAEEHRASFRFLHTEVTYLSASGGDANLDVYAPLRMRIGEPDPDLADLPLDVRIAAHVFSNGEVAWPNEHARAAVEALTATGKRILGLDARTLYPDGGVMEVPISAWSESRGPRDQQVDQSRIEALDALPLAISEGTHVLVTWD